MNKTVRTIVLIIAIGVMLFAGYKAGTTLMHYIKAATAYKGEAEEYVTPHGGEQSGKSGSAEASRGDMEKIVVEGDPEADAAEGDGGVPIYYAPPAPIDVDFEKLLAANGDYKAWLYCGGTNINYPVMQGADNFTYLHHLPDHSYNFSGSLFIDDRNEDDFSEAETVIYGHSMKNGTMFGTLEKYKQDPDYYAEHPCFWLLTPEGNYRLDVIAGYIVPSDSDIYDIGVPQEELLKQVLDRAEESFIPLPVDRETLEGTQHVVLLSTCSHAYDEARCVIVTVMVPCVPEEYTDR